MHRFSCKALPVKFGCEHPCYFRHITIEDGNIAASMQEANSADIGAPFPTFYCPKAIAKKHPVAEATQETQPVFFIVLGNVRKVATSTRIGPNRGVSGIVL